MSRYEIRSHFKRWLSRHIELFPYRPFLCEETDLGDLYRFQGVTPLLSLWVDSYQFIIIVEYYRDCWDIIYEFDCPARHDDRGFYCELCLPEYRKYYQSLSALYEEHSFLPLIDWCHENFKISKRIYFYRGKAWREAYLGSAQDFEHLKREDSPYASLIGVEPVLTTAFLPKTSE